MFISRTTGERKYRGKLANPAYVENVYYCPSFRKEHAALLTSEVFC